MPKSAEDEEFDVLAEEILLLQQEQEEELESEADQDSASPYLKSETAEDFIIRRAQSHPIWTQSIERKLIKAFQSGDDRALDKILFYNQRLAYQLALKFSRLNLLEVADLYQEAMLGLIRAAEKFDLSKTHKGKHIRFSTYATWWMRATISKALAEKGRGRKIPTHILEKIFKARRAYADFMQKHLRLPTCKELAEYCNLPVKDVLMCKTLLTRIESLDKLRGDENNVTFMNLVESKFGNPADSIEWSADKEKLDAAIEELNFDDAIFIKYRFGMFDGCPRTMTQMSHLYSITKEQVLYRERRILKAIANLIDSNSLNAARVMKPSKAGASGDKTVTEELGVVEA